MKKTILAVLGLVISVPGAAQLPADPWAPGYNAGPTAYGRAPTEYHTPFTTPNYVPVAGTGTETPMMRPMSAGDYRGGVNNPNNIPVPNYVGTMGTWNTAMGQREIAPDVNITNMLLMTDHLRKAGYQIPAGLDTLITTAPAKLRAQIMASLQFMQQSGHPASVAADGFGNIFERQTGLSITNLIENSLRIIDERR